MTDVSGDAEFNIGGWNTGTQFTGHLEFVYFGTGYNIFSGDEWSYNATTDKVSSPPACPTGTVQTILWRDNGGGNYTNMGDASISFTCIVEGPDAGSTVTSGSPTIQISPGVTNVPASGVGGPETVTVNPN
jgi:hypothetical protein